MLREKEALLGNEAQVSDVYAHTLKAGWDFFFFFFVLMAIYAYASYLSLFQAVQNTVFKHQHFNNHSLTLE